MYKRTVTKPDGRVLHLYSRRPIPEGLVASSPRGEPPVPNPHLRWHPLRGEWVAYASYRQDRTFLPPPAFDPLAPMTDSASPTELPSGDYDAAVFDNRFPALVADAPEPPGTIVEARPGTGAYEMVVFTREPTGSLGTLPLSHLELLIEVWADRTAELETRADVAYVMPFENRGVDAGATLPHPHGQIYAYPFVPPVPARELDLQRAHLERTGAGLLESHLQAELADGGGRRIVVAGDAALAFVPAFARFPYECWIAPLVARPALIALTADERRDVARVLQTTVRAYDALWGTEMPYLLAIHQAPTDGREHPEAHVHIELLPLHRGPAKRKYLAGTEIGAGMFTNDGLPEVQAAELRAVVEDLP